ncbi:GTPase-activating protein [Nowakowskiella sp. JEL0078]|nr:GTPase-activating protein [Nowakowskiella sp. JEL0078]
MDELFANARNFLEKYDSSVGHLSGFCNLLFTARRDFLKATFLVKWSDKLKKMEFQDIMMFLQSLPTSSWEEKDIEMLLAEAFMLKELFHNSPSHLSGAVTSGNRNSAS